MDVGSAHNKHATVPMLEDLNGKVCRAAETVEADGHAGFDRGALDRAVADDACAEQRRGVLVVDGIRQRVGKIFAHRREISEATVGVPAHKARVRAQILAPAAAELARSVGFAQPRNAHARADVRRASTQGRVFPRRRRSRGPVPFAGALRRDRLP